MQFSVIVPVYNRPEEVDELLRSLTLQRYTDFEVVVVEDGSTKDCQSVCQSYKETLNLKYFVKENSGPGPSRNYGAQRASGDYLLILDSDVVVPETYVENIHRELESDPCDAFGGADAAHPAFSLKQKAISYAMTSFFTTGGIRGGRGARMDKFYPRSFNMGISRQVFASLGGFSSMRYGEDIDLSIRIFEAGYKCRLFSDAWVWHKRRGTFSQFFHQVFHSGEARIALWEKHPRSLKMVHCLPSVFVLGVSLLVLLTVVGLWWGPWAWWGLSPIVLYAVIIFVHSSIVNKSMIVGVESVPAAFVQLFGYGSGFIVGLLRHLHK